MVIGHKAKALTEHLGWISIVGEQIVAKLETYNTKHVSELKLVFLTLFNERRKIRKCTCNRFILFAKY